MLKRFLIVLGVIILLIAGVLGVQMYRYIRECDRSDRMYYSREAHISYFPEYVEDNGLGRYKNSTYEILETKKFKSVEELCANLPAGFSNAVKDAMSSGTTEDGYDLKNKQVTLYEINPELLPLEETDSEHELECHYCVMEYRNKKYRFAVISAIAHTR